MDEYTTACEYLVEFTLKSGNGRMLREIKVVMDTVRQQAAELAALRALADAAGSG